MFLIGVEELYSFIGRSDRYLVLLWVEFGEMLRLWPLKVYLNALSSHLSGGYTDLVEIDMPTECRGLFSGVLQQGYAVGYVLAAIINLYVVPHSHLHWKALFYIGAALTAAVGIARVFFPESKQFLEQREKARQNPELQVTGREKVKAFTNDAKKIFKVYWKRSVYAIILMGMDFDSFSHRVGMLTLRRSTIQFYVTFFAGYVYVRPLKSINKH